MTSNSEWLSDTLYWLLDSDDSDFHQEQLLSNTINAAPLEQIESLLERVIEHCESVAANPARVRKLMQWTAGRIVNSRSNAQEGSDKVNRMISASLLEQFYSEFAEIDAIVCAHVLQCLASQLEPASLITLAGILKEKPPEQWQDVAIGLSPLWNANPDALQDFFDHVVDSPIQSATLPVLLDLANHSVRTGRLGKHPLECLEPTLRKLLLDVVIQLEKFEKDPSQFGSGVREIQSALADGISIAVSLCDALGLIGQPESRQSLLEAMDLSHRRIQVEAAAALVRIGEPLGKDRLVALASDAVARLRAVQYAEELDIADAIDEKFRYPLALAESELASWLASPEQYGVAPDGIENADCRTLYWPGYEEPRDCALFRFQYQFPSGTYTNVGLTGPLTHAFSVSLLGLELDDVYAAFAGWQTEHDEIFEVPAGKLNAAQQLEARRLERAFHDEGYRVEATIALTFLLGEPSLLARLVRDGKSYLGITNGFSLTAFSSDESPIANNPDMVLAVYRGRKLLKAFND